MLQMLSVSYHRDRCSSYIPHIYLQRCYGVNKSNEAIKATILEVVIFQKRADILKKEMQNLTLGSIQVTDNLGNSRNI